MSSAVSSRSPRSPEQIRFFARHYHMLKGLCYAPAGALLAAVTLVVALLRPTWLETVWVPLGLVVGSILLTAPWAYVMHRRYRRAYGHVTGMDGGGRWPLGQGDLSLAEWMAYMLGMLLWMVVLLLYIPDQLNYDDNHMLFFFAALPLAKGILSAPAHWPRLVYGGGVLVLIGVTLTPLLGWPVVLVQTACYTALGIVVAGIGTYNHRLLVDTLGPPAEEGASDA